MDEDGGREIARWGNAVALLLGALLVGVVGIVVLTAISAYQEDRKGRTAVEDIFAIDAALRSHHARVGGYPGTAVGYLVVDPTLPTIDPWGHPYRYVQPGKVNVDFDLQSFGRDGVASVDDIMNW